LDFKSATLYAVRVVLHSADPARLSAALDKRMADAGSFFENEPVVIDASQVEESIDWPALLEALRGHNLPPIGVVASGDNLRGAREAGLAPVELSTPPQRAQQADAGNAAPPPMPTQPAAALTTAPAPTSVASDGNAAIEAMTGATGPGAQAQAGAKAAPGGSSADAASKTDASSNGGPDGSAAENEEASADNQGKAGAAAGKNGSGTAAGNGNATEASANGNANGGAGAQGNAAPRTQGAPQPIPSRAARETTSASSPTAGDPQSSSALVITKPLRSGQRVYARHSDLVVIGMVSQGAEVIADGNVHVYGPLRGKAMAGARGDTSARIFTTHLDAELLAVAGVYRVVEDKLDATLHGHPALVRLDGDTLRIEALKG
jgi:septum site-determining protein MinC